MWGVGRTVADGSCDVGKDFQAAHGTVHLSACVVGDNDSRAANLVRLDRVGHALDALQDERSSAGDFVPLAVRERRCNVQPAVRRIGEIGCTDLLDQPLDLVPRMRLPVPHTRVDPTAFIVRQVGTVLSHEDRIRFSQLVAGGAWIVEPAARSKLMYSSVLMKMDSIRVVRNVDISRTPAKLPGVGGQHQDIEA